MAQEITIDGSGRLVIPKRLRRHHHLTAGTRLTLIEEKDRLVLIPHQHEPQLVEKDGLLVVEGGATVELPDHRILREERLGQLGGAE